MHNCKLFIFFSDELKIIQCRSDNPASFVLDMPGLDTQSMDSALFCRVEWHDGRKHRKTGVKLRNYEGVKAVFEPISSTLELDEEPYHLVEVNDFMLVCPVPQAEIMEYKAKADYINKKFRSSLTTQIRQLIMEESVTNQYIFKLLLQIDSKLDELLSTQENTEADNFEQTRMLSLSGGGITFLSDEAEPGQIFFVQTDTRYNTGTTFAALCKIRETIKTDGKTICEADFVHIDETTRDSIIKTVFEKDREKLKRKNS